MSSFCQQLYQIAQIREIEQLAIQEQVVTEEQMMDRAGAEVCHTLLYNWPDARYFAVACGKGNNAGDGYVVAYYLLQRGRHVRVLQAEPEAKLKGVALNAYQQFIEEGGEAVAFSSEALDKVDVVVDALLGIGLRGEVKEPYKSIIDQFNDCQRPVLAVDGPSGLNADTGFPLGKAVKASVTVSMIRGKPGFYTGAGMTYCGKVVCADLGLPDQIIKQVAPYAQRMTYKELANHLPARPRHAHKGHFGRVLVVGGDEGMVGAVRMAGEATLRAGAGLVKVATHPKHLAIVASQRPELLCQEAATGEDLDDCLDWCDVIEIGPGLGESEWSWQLFNKVAASSKTKVIDADGLNLLAQLSDKERQACLGQKYILTPHPGEAARLLGVTVKDVQADRYQAIKDLHQKFGGAIVLKGAGSLITHKQQLTVSNTGNPGMATAGMGDVLTGILGAFLAQGLDAYTAAFCGVFCHGYAGDLAAGNNERGLMALDVIETLPQAINPVQFKIKGAYE